MEIFRIKEPDALRLSRQAALGAQKAVRANVLRPCPTCDGAGAEPGCEVRECTLCRGTGEVVRFPGGRAGEGTHISPSPSILRHAPCNAARASQDANAVSVRASRYSLDVLIRVSEWALGAAGGSAEGPVFHSPLDGSPFNFAGCSIGSPTT